MQSDIKRAHLHTPEDSNPPEPETLDPRWMSPVMQEGHRFKSHNKSFIQVHIKLNFLFGLKLDKEILIPVKAEKINTHSFKLK